MLIEAVISGNRNFIKKKAKNFLKYEDPTIEIQCMWNVKKSDIIYNTSNWNHLRIIQTAILGTTHILWAVKVKSPVTGLMWPRRFQEV